MHKIKLVSLIFIVLNIIACASSKQLKMKQFVEFKTTEGDFVIGLYEATPLHRDNFIKNCNGHFYDSLLICKVTHNGLIVMGDSASKFADTQYKFQQNFADTLLKSEINDNIFNLRGAVGAMMLTDTSNFDKKTSSSVFYVVYGENYSIEKIDAYENFKNAEIYKKYIDELLQNEQYKPLKDSLDFYKYNRDNKNYGRLYLDALNIVKPQLKKEKVKLFSISDKRKNSYVKNGGLVEMDYNFTVFGKIVFGIENIEQIGKVKTGLHQKPRYEIRIISTKVMNKKEWKKREKELHN